MSTDTDTAAAPRLIFPVLGGFYRGFAQPLAWVVLRVTVGGALVLEGWPKIIAPLAQTGFVESIGFHPGWLWSPLLAVMQFVGGVLLALGLLTRPVALANGVMLAVTLWFHATHPYGDALLTQAGIEALQGAGAELFNANGLSRLADGGAAFLAQVQDKAVFLSAIWTIATLFFAGYGGGALSVDRALGREF